MLRWTAVTALWALFWTGPSQSQPPVSALQSHAWDGLSRLASTATTAGVSLAPAPVIDPDASDSDAGYLVMPGTPIAVRRAVLRLVQRGARCAQVFDVQAQPADLETVQLTAAPDWTSRARSLRAHADIFVAVPTSTHPLTSGVRGLLTNHPLPIAHGDLEPMFRLGPMGPALAYVAASGAGQLVLIGDGSVLINDVMAHAGNRRFARNLLRFLAGPGRRPVHLVDRASRLPASRWQPERVAAVVGSTLRSWAGRPPQGRTVMVLGWLLMVLLVAAAVLAQPAASRFGRIHQAAGVDGRPRGPSPGQLAAMTVLREELQSALNAVQAPGRHAAAQPADFARARRLLADLVETQVKVDAQGTRSISQRQFRTMMSDGNHILMLISSSTPRPVLT